MADGVQDTNIEVNEKPAIQLNEKTPSKDKKLSVLESHGYAVGRNVGSGAYATVKIARSDRHKCDVAIKIVSKIKEADDYLRKFLPREIEVVKGLKHDNLIRYYQAIETTHRVYIIMEYADNGCLLDVIKKDTVIDNVRALAWFKQLVAAVRYCHENGVVHRDIKCENLLLDTANNIKLSDFGFARNNMLKKNGQMKMSQTFCGSYAYASPEILNGTPYQPNTSDIWSIGVVLYAMVFGTLPFDDSTFPKLLKQVQKRVVFPRDTKVSENCKDMILKLLAPLKVRLTMPQIQDQPWYQESKDSADKKDTGQPKDTGQKVEEKEKLKN